MRYIPDDDASASCAPSLTDGCGSSSVSPIIRMVQCAQNREQMVEVPLNEAVRRQIQRLLIERQIKVRLTELIAEFRKREDCEFPP